MSNAKGGVYSHQLSWSVSCVSCVSLCGCHQQITYFSGVDTREIRLTSAESSALQGVS